MFSRYFHILCLASLLIGVLTFGMAPASADEGNTNPAPVTDCGAWDFTHVILKNIDGQVFNISFEWMPFDGAATYRFKLHRQGTAPFEYLLYGDLGTLVDVSDLEPNVAGAYTFMVTAYDANGAALCTTSIEKHSFEIVSVYVYAPPAPASAPTPTPTECTPYVVVLPGSPYTGAADITPGGDNYDGRGLDCGATIHGNNNSNIIYGTPYDDVIYGYGGDDEIHGDFGDDTIYGGADQDVIYGDTGSDSIEGDTGTDMLFGGWDNRNGQNRDDIGHDSVSDTGGDDGDRLFGGNNNSDNSAGNDGNDTLIDSDGNGDFLFGGNLNLAIGHSSTGNDGSDSITDGGGYLDLIFGGNFNGGSSNGDDNVDGGNDSINTQDGIPGDLVHGGNLNVGGTGIDFGAGSDTLNCDARELVCNQGNF